MFLLKVHVLAAWLLMWCDLEEVGKEIKRYQKEIKPWRVGALPLDKINVVLTKPR